MISLKRIESVFRSICFAFLPCVKKERHVKSAGVDARTVETHSGRKESVSTLNGQDFREMTPSRSKGSLSKKCKGAKNVVEVHAGSEDTLKERDFRKNMMSTSKYSLPKNLKRVRKAGNNWNDDYKVPSCEVETKTLPNSTESSPRDWSSSSNADSNDEQELSGGTVSAPGKMWSGEDLHSRGEISLNWMIEKSEAIEELWGEATPTVGRFNHADVSDRGSNNTGGANNYEVPREEVCFDCEAQRFFSERRRNILDLFSSAFAQMTLIQFLLTDDIKDF